MAAQALKLSLELTAEASGLAAGIAASRRGLDGLRTAAAEAGRSLDGALGAAQTRGAARELAADYGELSGRTREIQAAAAAAAASQRGLAGAVAGGAGALGLAARAAGLLGASLGVAEAVRYADAWKQVEGRLRLVTDSTGELHRVQGLLFDTAQRTRASFEATADAYSRFARATQGLGVDGRELLGVTEAVGKAVAISGGSAAGAEAALMQLGQAMAAGALRGDELNSVLEQAPRLAQAIAAGMGKPLGELRALAEQGKLTTQAVLAALQNQAGALDREFRQLDTTVAQSWTKLENAVLRYVGQTDAATGATRALADGMGYLAEHFDDAVRAATALGIAMAGLVAGPRLAQAVGDWRAAAGASEARRAALVGEAAALRTLADGELAAARAAQTAARDRLSTAAKQVDTGRELADRTRLAAYSGAYAAAGKARADADALVAKASTAAAMAAEGQTSAQAALAAGYGRTTLAARAAAAAQGAWNAALAFVGGPIGAAVLVTAGAVAYLATRTTDAERAQAAYSATLADGRRRLDELRGASAQRAAQLMAEQRETAAAAAVEAAALAARAAALREEAAALAALQADSGLPGITAGADAAVAALSRELAEAERRAQAAAAALEGMRSALSPQGDASWAERVAQSTRRMTVALSDAEKAAGLVANRTGYLTAEQDELARYTAQLQPVIDAGGAAWTRYGRTAAQAAGLLETLRLKLDPVRAAIADLNAEINLLHIPEGFERDFAQLLGRVTGNGQLALGAEQIRELRAALADRSAAQTGDDAGKLEREAAGARLLSGALTEAAKAHAQNRIALAEAAARYPDLGQATAKALLETRDFATAVTRLPEPLRRLWEAMESRTTSQLAGAAAEAALSMTAETRAAQLLADAAGKGEAAQRRARIEAEVYAATLKGQGAAARAAAEAQEAAAVTQIRGEQTSAIETQIRANERLAAAYAEAPGAVDAAQRAEQARALALREALPDTEAYRKAYERYLALLERGAAAEQKAALAQQGAASQDQIRLLDLELSLQSEGERTRNRTLALARAELDLRRRFPLATEEAIQAELRRQATIIDTGERIKQERAVWDELGGFLSQTFDKVGTALTEAFAQGKISAVDFGNITRAVLSEAIQLALRLAVINPVSNWITGGSLPSLWGAGVGVAGAAGGGAGTAAGTAAGAGLGSPLGALGSFGSLGGLLGGGSAALSLGRVLLGGASLTGGSALIGNAFASAGNWLGGADLAASFGNAGLAFSSPVGSLGSFAASMLADAIFGGDRGIGASIGGTIGSIAGSFLGPLGTIGGSFIGNAIGGLFGNSHPSVGPNSQAYAEFDASGRVYRQDAAADNGGNADATRQTVAALQQALIGFGQQAGVEIGRQMLVVTHYDQGPDAGTATRLGGGPGTGTVVSRASDPAVIAGDLVRFLADHTVAQDGTVSATPQLQLSALQRKGLRDGVGIDEMAGDIAWLGSLEKGIAGLQEVDRSLAGLAETARKAQADAFKPLTDELERATKLGVGGEYRELVGGQLRQLLDGIANPVEWGQTEQAMATLTGQLSAVREAAAGLGLDLGAEVDAAQARARDRILSEYARGQQTRELEVAGRQYIGQIQELQRAQTAAVREATGLGADAARESAIWDSQIRAAVQQLDQTQLQDLIATMGDLGGASGRLASLMADAAQQQADAARQAADAAAQAAASLRARSLTALGRGDDAERLSLSLRQADERRQAVASGGDLRLLDLVQAVERQQAEVDRARAQVVAGYERDVAALDAAIAARQTEAQAARDAAQALLDWSQAARATRERLVTDERLSPLAPEQRQEQTDALLRQYYGVATDSTKSQGERDAAWQRFQGLVEPALTAFRAGTSDWNAYNEYVRQIDTMLAAIDRGPTAEEALRRTVEDSGDAQLDALTRQREELVRQREAYERGTGAVTGSIADLRGVADQQLATLVGLQSLLAADPGVSPADADARAAVAQILGSRATLWETLGGTEAQRLGDPRWAQTQTAMQTALARVTDTGWLEQQRAQAAAGGSAPYAAELAQRLQELTGRDDTAEALAGAQYAIGARDAEWDRLGGLGLGRDQIFADQRFAVLTRAEEAAIGRLDNADALRALLAANSYDGTTVIEQQLMARLRALGVPGFAAGGLHAGGVRLVGEAGPELEVTGPARYWPAADTARMLAAAANGEGGAAGGTRVVVDLAPVTAGLATVAGAVAAGAERTAGEVAALSRQVAALSQTVDEQRRELTRLTALLERRAA